MHRAPISDIFTLLQVQARERGKAIAIESAAGVPAISYETLLLRTTALMNQLAQRGVTRKGERSRVAIVLPNGPDMALVLLAVSCAGVAVPLNPAYEAGEFRSYFTEIGVSFVLVEQGYAGAARAVAVDLGLELLELAATDGLLDAGAVGVPCGAPAEGDVALILLTSGSTGRAKRVPLTHRNLCTSALDVARSMSLDSRDRCLCMWEQFHIGGLVDLLLAPLASGGSVVYAGSFEVARFFTCLDAFRPSWFQGVPTTLREACFFAKTHGVNPRGSSLRLIRSVAAALPEAWMAEIEDRFGVPVIQTFGMTEASPLITSTGIAAGEHRPGSAGKPCGPSVRIMDDQGRPQPPFGHGQIAVRGDNIFKGYEGDDDANAEAFRDGWFYTGDVGYLDADGFLFLSGRMKEVINRGGEKILPYEIDEVLLTHPEVEQAAAFGFAHPTLGEEVGVAIVPKPGQTPDEKQIREFVSARLASFKIPRKIVFLAELPRCPVGKVRRQEVAAIASQLSAKNQYHAPRNGLETVLTGIWAAELDVDRVGIDDDFAELGGDSLTAVRLIAATQSLLGVTLPDQINGHMGSVRVMAQYMVQSCCLPHSPETRAWSEHFGSISAGEIRTAVSLIDNTAGQPLSFDPLAASEMLQNCTSSNEFRQFRQAYLTRMTPRELMDLLDHQVAASFACSLGEILSWIRTWRWTRLKNAWRREVRAELAGKTAALRWTRQVLGDHVWWFTEDPNEDKTAKTLIACFTGYGHRLFMPIYRFLNQVHPGRHDVLLLGDPTRTHYASGIPGLVDSLEKLPGVLRQFQSEHGYPAVTAIGTSAGGVAAIIVALQNQWTKVIAIGADNPASHEVLNAMMDRLPPDGPDATQVILAYAGKNARDMAAAAEISCKIPQVQLYPDMRFSRHNLLEELHQRGEMSDFLRKLLL